MKAALKQAQKKAELEELRAKAYDKMITLAEESLNIPIRKKSGIKQSYYLPQYAIAEMLTHHPFLFMLHAGEVTFSKNSMVFIQ